MSYQFIILLFLIVSQNCVATSWNATGEKLLKVRPVSSSAVDNDFNIYTTHKDLKTLQKWFPSTNKIINLFENQFPDTPLFYHSLSGSLYYFMYIKINRVFIN
jgi:hypothetical protein